MENTILELMLSALGAYKDMLRDEIKAKTKDLLKITQNYVH